MTETLFINLIRCLNQMHEEGRLTTEQIKAVAAFVIEITDPECIAPGKKPTASDLYRLKEQTMKILHDVISEQVQNPYTTG